MRILIVKLSSLGDVIQSLHCISYLKSIFPTCTIDWVCQEESVSLLTSISEIEKIYCFKWGVWKKKLFKRKKEISSFIKSLRNKKYDVVFDLQGNCKSGLITIFSRGNKKVGFGKKSVSEWPNLLATHVHINVDKEINIRLQYLQIIKKFFQKDKEEIKPLNLRTDKKYQKDHISDGRYKMIISVGAKWKNKRLNEKQMISFLNMIKNDFSFLFIWGDNEEKLFAEKVCEKIEQGKILEEKLPLESLHQLISKMDVVFAFDSAVLHLAGLADIPTFSVFGPTSAKTFKPIGSHHGYYQSSCPYHKQFIKRCNILRSCETNGCMEKILSKDLLKEFISWWKKKDF